MATTSRMYKKLVVDMLKPVVLELLSVQPAHGYAVIAVIRKRHGVWLSASTVYPELARMQKEELISAEWDLSGERPRKVYTILPKGKQVLREYLCELKMLVQPLLTIAKGV